jgi:hypothetical protein
MDSGIFTYVNNGVNWFPDIGGDDYNVYNYFEYGIRQNYYRLSTEGHNLVTITSLPDELPFGQSYTGGGVVTDFVSEDAGMYSIIDNAGAYGNITNYARRGMLLTNNRTTVVIQDEIAFKGVQSCVWIAHTQASISISPNGKTAILGSTSAGRPMQIRVTLLSSNPKLKFEKMDAGVNDFIFEGTHRPGYSESFGQLPERSRKSYSRLVIKAENTLVFDTAVVIETIEAGAEDRPVEYDYVKMANWKIEDSYNGLNVGSGNSAEEDSTIIKTAKMTDIKTYSTMAEKYIQTGYAFSTRTTDFFRAITRVNVAVNTYRPETFKNIPQIYSAYEKYLVYRAQYDAYTADINASNKQSSSLGVYLSLV